MPENLSPATPLGEALSNLLDTFGLETILEQNDITDFEVLYLLYVDGLIDLGDYFYTDIEVEEEDDSDIEDLFSYWDEDN